MYNTGNETQAQGTSRWHRVRKFVGQKKSAIIKDVRKNKTMKAAGELRQMARETFGKYYGDKVQSELVHNFAKYGLVLHKGENNNVQKYGGELSKVRRRVA